MMASSCGDDKRDDQPDRTHITRPDNPGDTGDQDLSDSDDQSELDDRGMRINSRTIELRYDDTGVIFAITNDRKKITITSLDSRDQVIVELPAELELICPGETITVTLNGISTDRTVTASATDGSTTWIKTGHGDDRMWLVVEL